eukprot:1635945-Alexandrium_andersonii.AAC.1
MHQRCALQLDAFVCRHMWTHASDTPEGMRRLRDRDIPGNAQCDAKKGKKGAILDQGSASQPHLALSCPSPSV